MIRQVVLAIAMIMTAFAQRSPASRLVDVMVFGKHMLVDGQLKGFDRVLQAEVDAYVARVLRYRSKLVRPAKMESVDGMVYEARVNDERMLAAVTANPRGPALAAAYVAALRPCYEWEGYHDCPEREAVFADRYQSTHPSGPFHEFLPLLAAHRWLCTADAYVYEKMPEGERRARNAYEKDIAIAKGSSSALIRAGAEALAERGACLAPESNILPHVTDAAGNAIPGVTVTALPSSPVVKCVTDVHGRCGLLELTPGHYHLEASLSGFVTENAEVDLVDGQGYQWEVKMKVRVSPGREDLVRRITELAGPTPLDCGRFRPSGPPFREASMTEIQPSLVCAAAAAQQRKPFWVSITYPGIDSTVVGGLLGTSEGVVYRFDFDSDPCGGAGCGSRFTTERCDHPSLAQRGDSVRFVCSSAASER